MGTIYFFKEKKVGRELIKSGYENVSGGVLWRS